MLETVEEAAENWRIDDIKGLLGRCNFKANMLDRKVSLLSGGEKVTKTCIVSTIAGHLFHNNVLHKKLCNFVILW